MEMLNITISTMAVNLGADSINLTFPISVAAPEASSNGLPFQSKFHFIWLRDNCHCAECYHETTKQRLLDTFSVPIDVFPKKVWLSDNDTKLEMYWSNNGHRSVYLLKWLLENAYQPEYIQKSKPKVIEKVPWDVPTIRKEFPKVDYHAVMDSDDGLKEWVNKAYIYGFCLVENVPVDPRNTKELLEKVTFIKPTHYGGFWDFTPDLSMNDTAYTNIAIPLHTDGTYWTEAPGYQSFHLLKHEGKGGVTTLCDGVRCAEILREENPLYFKVLSTVPVDFHCAGEENVFIQPAVARPIIILDSELGKHSNVVQIRWNNLDRSAFKIPKGFDVSSIKWDDKIVDKQDLVTLFYKALYAFHALLHDCKNEFEYPLKPGQVLLFDNWRVLHSRTSFTGERRMCGAYYTKDDFISRFKTLNYSREELVKNL